MYVRGGGGETFNSIIFVLNFMIISYFMYFEAINNKRSDGWRSEASRTDGLHFPADCAGEW